MGTGLQMLYAKNKEKEPGTAATWAQYESRAEASTPS
jgi:hypothetical protein